MPGRKQTRRTTVKDVRAILRLSHGQGLSEREVAGRLKLSRATVSTYLLRAREAGLSSWPLPAVYEDDAVLEQLLFRRMGRPPRDTRQPHWPTVAAELKRKGVTLSLLWQEYRAAHPDGYGYTWFCDAFRAFERRTHASWRNRHEAGAVMQTDYAGQTVEIVDPETGEIHEAQIFVAVLGASSYTFATASLTQRLPDWIAGQCEALAFFGGVPKSIVCDNLKAGVAKPLWFEPTLNATFAALAEHYDTTVLPTRPRKPRDKAKVEVGVQVVERWILARLRNRRFFSLGQLNAAIRVLLDELNDRPMRHLGQSRRQMFEAIERAALAPLPKTSFEYAEWKTAKVHPDYHVDVERTFYSVPHSLIGRTVRIRLTRRTVEVFHSHKRVAAHVRRSPYGGHVTVAAHMPSAHRRYADRTPASLIGRARRIGPNTAVLVERMMRDRPHPEQGYRSAMGVISLARRYEAERVEAACERALTINALSYSSLTAILRSGLDRAAPEREPLLPLPTHDNIRGPAYYR